MRVRAKKESSVEFVWERFVCVCVGGGDWLMFGEFGKREREVFLLPVLRLWRLGS